jgi:3-oxoacyl-[acyl-carrier-protein] synthase-3
MATASILATGSYLPERVVTNDELATIVDTSDEWIRSHIGIGERRLSSGESTSEMALQAARRALAQVEGDPPLDGIIVATQTPDKIVPATACMVQHRLGLTGCFAVDVNAACTGFIHALHFAGGLLQSGAARRLLIIGAERMSRLVNWCDRSTCVIFADGAGAVVLGSTRDGERTLANVLDSVVHCDGTGEEVIHVPAGGSSLPLTHENLDQGLQYIHMDGHRVFGFAVNALASTVRELAERCGTSLSEVAHIIPHQANQRIIDEGMTALGMPAERAVTHIERYGNTCAASIPIALDENARDGHFHCDELIALVAFGTGLTWGGALLKWTR